MNVAAEIIEVVFHLADSGLLSVELVGFTSPARPCGPTIAVQVIDIFANEHLAVFKSNEVARA